VSTASVFGGPVSTGLLSGTQHTCPVTRPELEWQLEVFFGSSIVDW